VIFYKLFLKIITHLAQNSISPNERLDYRATLQSIITNNFIVSDNTN